MTLRANNIFNIMSVITDIEDSVTAQEVFDKFTNFSRCFGFEHVAMGLVVNPAMTNRPASSYAITNFPEELHWKYDYDSYLLHDPVIRYALSSNALFQWRSANEYASKFGKKISGEMADLSLNNGICIPLKVGYFPKGIISLSHENPDLIQDEMINLHLVSIHAYTHFLKLVDVAESKSFIDLSKREIEVLHYVAGGKSNWCIGKILGISEDGVKKHMSNISRKLDASNRAHAVTLAINSGQILP